MLWCIHYTHTHTLCLYIYISLCIFMYTYRPILVALPNPDEKVHRSTKKGVRFLGRLDIGDFLCFWHFRMITPLSSKKSLMFLIFLRGGQTSSTLPGIILTWRYPGKNVVFWRGSSTKTTGNKLAATKGTLNVLP